MDKRNYALIISFIVFLLILIWGVILPNQMMKVLDSIFILLSSNFNWLVLLATMFFLIFSLAIAFGRYGSIKLGQSDDKPEYNTFSWISMMLTAGMGIGLIFWSIAEPITHYINPPFGDANTIEAMEIGLRFTFFHWGLHPWGVFAYGGLALAYFHFNKGFKCKISSTVGQLFKGNVRDIIEIFIDILTIMAIVIGLAVSLGLGTIQINSGLFYLYGVADNTIIKVIIIIVTTFIFTFIAMRGINRGIRLIANGTVLLSILLLVFLLVSGPSGLILRIITKITGDYFQNIIGMSLWIDDILNSGWTNKWTVFYWAWWITWVPFVAQFIAKISKGRTIKEFILGAIMAPTVFSFIWISVLSGAAIHAMQNLKQPIDDLVTSNIAFSLFATLNSYKIPSISNIIALLLIVGFYITSACSGIFVLGLYSNDKSSRSVNAIKLAWGIILGGISAVIIYSSGIKGLQNVSLIIAFPFIGIMFLMGYSLIKDIKKVSKQEKVKCKISFKE